MGLGQKEKNTLKYLIFNITLPWGCIFYSTKFLNKYFLQYNSYFSVVSYIGAFSLVFYGGKIAKYFFDKLTKKPKDPTSYGKWAVISGATSGIGEAFAHDLASKGLNILLVSRSEDKLKKTQEGIKKTSLKDVDTQKIDYVTVDLGNSIKADQALALKTKLAQIHENSGGIGLLINCAGVVNLEPTPFHEMDDGLLDSILSVNNDGTARMTKYVLPYMYQRKSGAVITVGSGSCHHPSAMISAYSATKAFGYQLSRSLHYEYKQHGIDFVALTPYLFVSNMYQDKKNSLLAPYPQTIIDATYPLLGVEEYGFPYWFHWMMGMVQYVTFENVGEGFLKINERAIARAKARKQKKV
jgi:17beta-estradiol 17-dehydrogenase / very-long-chain 3-oxoacyl-CoA reductase